MRARITTDAQGYVTLEYDENSYWGEGERVKRVFMCPYGGGYVQEHMGNGVWKQVCDRLSCLGSTLSCPSREVLPDVIRSEYKEMRRAEEKEYRKYGY